PPFEIGPIADALVIAVGTPKTARGTEHLLTLEEGMAASERFEVLVLGSGAGGKLLAWDMARSGRRTAVVERQWIGGSCPNVNCMPSKNELASAHVAHVARHAAESGTKTGRACPSGGRVEPPRCCPADAGQEGRVASRGQACETSSQPSARTTAE